MRLRYCFALGAIALGALGCKGGSSGPPAADDTSNANVDGGCAPNPPVVAGAVRLLEQAAFGPTPALISQVQCQGYGPWLTAQMALAPTHYDMNDLGTTQHTQDQFYTFALTAPDQLRQRVALALSEILVVSAVKLRDDNDALANHMNLILDNMWGTHTDGSPFTYEDLLYQVSIGPAMGRYLDMVDNSKASKTSNPNENYARELMQLFAIGLNYLNDDGTLGSRPLPLTFCTTSPASATYCQDDVDTLSNILTGWTYGPQTGKWANPPDWDVPMVVVNSHHDTTNGSLLGVTYTSSGDAGTDLQAILDIISKTSVSAQSMPPFICKQLIQHLVSSNPSTAFISACVAKFKDDGSKYHARGNLKEVVRTILLDPEARNLAMTPTAYGHLREPALYIANLLRLLDYQRSDGMLAGINLTAYGTTMDQTIFAPTTVFNYFPPDFPLPGQAQGSTLLCPECGIENSATVYARANWVNNLLYKGLGTGSAIVLPGPFPTVTGLINWLDTYMLHNTMSAALKSTLTTAIGTQPNPLPASAIERGIYLVATSSQYKVEQ